MPKRERHPVSRYAPGEQDRSPVVQEDAPLTPHGAFVVQFRAMTGQAPGYFAGRAEHMTSGQAVRFSSPEELVAFLARVLTQVPAEPP